MARAHLALPLLLAGACVSSNVDSAVVILNNEAVTGECVATGSSGASFLSSGIIDVAGAGSDVGYVLTPVVQNFATGGTGDGDQLRIAFVHGARIDIHFNDPAQESALYPGPLTRFEVPLAASIDPGGTIGLVFEIVPADLLPMLNDGELLLVDVKIFGELGGSSFESANFRYPVEVCNGCTVQDVGDCAAFPGTGEGTPHGCNPYQDFTVQCCTSDTVLVCPAEGTGA